MCCRYGFNQSFTDTSRRREYVQCWRSWKGNVQSVIHGRHVKGKYNSRT